jgi:hypothetical protein
MNADETLDFLASPDFDAVDPGILAAPASSSPFMSGAGPTWSYWIEMILIGKLPSTAGRQPFAPIRPSGPSTQALVGIQFGSTTASVVCGTPILISCGLQTSEFGHRTPAFSSTRRPQSPSN